MIYLDCDGVLADFDAYALEVFGLPSRQAETELRTTRFWVDLSEHPDFYLKLPVIDEGVRLYRAVAHLRPVILTGLPRGGWAEPQKIKWAEKFFPGVEVICCMSREKNKYCRPGDVLVDDWDKYRGLWESRGGRFIHHKGYASTVEELRRLGVLERPEGWDG